MRLLVSVRSRFPGHVASPKGRPAAEWQMVEDDAEIAGVSIPSHQETTKLLAINLSEVDLTEVSQHHWR
jgi:hypothetical protein